MAFKLGKLNISWGQKALKPVPGQFRVFGLTVTWSDTTTVDSYVGNADLYSVINLIADTAASVPFKVYRIKDKKKFANYKSWTGPRANKASLQKAMLLKESVFEEDNKHPLNLLIEKPNDFQSGSEFVANSIGFKLITGNRFWYVNKLDMGLQSGQPYSVYNLPPQYMTVKGDGTLFGVSGYKLNIGNNPDIPKESIIHSKFWNPVIDGTGSHLYGLSPLKAATKNLGVSEASLDRSKAVLDNAGAAGLIFDKGTNGEMDIEAAQELKRRVNNEVLGTENAGKIAVANGDLGYIQFGFSATEMNVLATQKYTLQQICNIYKVPYILLSADHSTMTNVPESKKQLITMAVAPALASIRADWNEIAKLFKGEDLYVDYDLSDLPEMQEDLEKTAKIMQMAWWIKPNEKRLAMGEDEDNDNPMMNEYLIPNNLVNINDIASLDNVMNQVDQQMNQP